MSHSLYEVAEVAARIRRGDALLLAGEEALLRQLPPGNWIAGTIPYFVDGTGVVERRRLFATALLPGLGFRGIRRYGEAGLGRIHADLPRDGFGVAIAPAGSPVHQSFALNSPFFDQFATRPLIGWIAGVHLSELGKVAPRVFDGSAAAALDRELVVMHVGLPPGKVAEIETVNIFQPGDGPTLAFPESGFTAREVEVDGVRKNLAAWVKETGLDTRLPLVADYCGTTVNVSIQTVDAAAGEVRFYAPVFAGVAYRHARPIGDYVQEFSSRVPRGLEQRIAFSCNCILNFLYSGMEGRKVDGPVMPITFGEVAYQLLNQTMVYLTIGDAVR